MLALDYIKRNPIHNKKKMCVLRKLSVRFIDIVSPKWCFSNYHCKYINNSSLLLFFSHKSGKSPDSSGFRLILCFSVHLFFLCVCESKHILIYFIWFRDSVYSFLLIFFCHLPICIYIFSVAFYTQLRRTVNVCSPCSRMT